MKEFLSHISAAGQWDILNIEDVLGFQITETDPAHITVTRHNAKFSSNREMVHSCVLDLPAGAVTARNGRAVASPELLFLELAGQLSIHRLILLGLQLCSHPPGYPSKAVTTKQKLKKFLAKTRGHRGHSKAVRAVMFLENGSNSIMESLTYMILTLPHALGGYGLSGAVFNYEIRLEGEAQARLGQGSCFVDLYYRQAKLAVEYDSLAYHSSPSKQGKDGIRSAVLERKGVDVMHLNTIQLYSRDACRDFAYNLASRLGKRMQIRTKKFDEMHILMRTLLPNRKTVSELEGKE